MNLDHAIQDLHHRAMGAALHLAGERPPSHATMRLARVLCQIVVDLQFALANDARQERQGGAKPEPSPVSGPMAEPTKDCERCMVRGILYGETTARQASVSNTELAT